MLHTFTFILMLHRQCIIKSKHQLKQKSHHGSTNYSWGFVGWCGRVGQWPCEPGLQLSHTSHTCRLHFSPPHSPLMWPSQPRDKWAQTWKTLRLAKNNMLSTDLLSRNANTKCSLCCKYTHFDMDSRGDSFLYIYVNACLRESLRCRDILWLQVAVLTLGWKGKTTNYPGQGLTVERW